MSNCEPKELYLHFSNKLEIFIRNRVQDEDLAKDILHDTFIKVIDCCKQDRQCEHPKAYVFQIANNLIYDYYRNQKKEIPVIDNDADAEPLNDEMIACLQPMLQQLPEKYKEAVRLADIEHLPQQQVADKLGISISGAKSRIQRGREKLKQLILSVCHVETDKYGNILRCDDKLDISHNLTPLFHCKLTPYS